MKRKYFISQNQRRRNGKNSVRNTNPRHFLFASYLISGINPYMPKRSKKKKFKIAFAADPLEHFDPRAETTSFLIDEMNKRGWDTFHFELKDLFLKNTTPHAITKKVRVTKKNKQFSYKTLNKNTLDLSTMDAVFLRKDPPFDLNYLDHLTILELLNQKTLLINNPTWIKHANEKLFSYHFKNLTPKTIVSQDRQLIYNFVKKQKSVVLKPLNNAGGKGVIWVKAKDPSLNSMIDVLTNYQTQYIIAQEYIPEAAKGDKRILILDGEILGAFTRVPPKNDFRGNLHSGAKMKKCSLTKRDKEVVAILKETTQKMGLYFLGIDIIGKYVTEINSTSPMGIREINEMNNVRIEKTMVDWLHNKLTTSL